MLWQIFIFSGGFIDPERERREMMEAGLLTCLKFRYFLRFWCSLIRVFFTLYTKAFHKHVYKMAFSCLISFYLHLSFCMGSEDLVFVMCISGFGPVEKTLCGKSPLKCPLPIVWFMLARKKNTVGPQVKDPDLGRNLTKINTILSINY